MTSPRHIATVVAMNPPNSPPRWVRQLHEDEAVWAAFDRRRVLRTALSALQKSAPASSAMEQISEELDWLEAEREVGRAAEAHGCWADERR